MMRTIVFLIYLCIPLQKVTAMMHPRDESYQLDVSLGHTSKADVPENSHDRTLPAIIQCDDSEIRVDVVVKTDIDPRETSWEILNGDGIVIESIRQNGYREQFREYSHKFCLIPGCYVFLIHDTGGYGDDYEFAYYYDRGFYEVTVDNDTVASGGDFDKQLDSERIEFCSSKAPTPLGTAVGFAILAKTGISATVSTPSLVTGDIGVSPIAATGITGFSLALDGSETFSRSSRVIGRVYASTYVIPTPAKMTKAISDMEAAYTSAANRAPPNRHITGAETNPTFTFVPGIYKWDGALTFKDLTLDGSETDIWTFQIAGVLTISSFGTVTLTGGALPQNIFWQVAGNTVLEPSSNMVGIILCMTDITTQEGSTLIGNALSQTAVNLIGSTITNPMFL